MSRRTVSLITFVKEEEAAVFASPILKRLGGVETITIAISLDLPKVPRKEAKEGKGTGGDKIRHHHRHRMCNG